MTLAVFLYLVKNQKLYGEEGEVFFTEDDIVNRSRTVEK
jgi:hypothetical protein